MKKSIIVILTALLVLTVLPMTVFANTDNSTAIYLGGVRLDVGESATCVDGAVVKSAVYSDSDPIRYNSGESEYVLTLDGVNITTGSYKDAVLYTHTSGYNKMTVNVLSDSSFSGSAVGIKTAAANVDVNIIGEATLNVTGADKESGSSYGIYCASYSSLRVGGNAKVVSRGGNAGSSYGVYSYEGVYLSDKASLTAVGGTGTNYSYGIKASYGVRVQPGQELIARGGDAPYGSYGIYNSSGESGDISVLRGTNVTVTGNTAAVYDKHRNSVYTLDAWVSVNIDGSNFELYRSGENSLYHIETVVIDGTENTQYTPYKFFTTVPLEQGVDIIDLSNIYTNLNRLENVCFTAELNTEKRDGFKAASSEQVEIANEYWKDYEDDFVDRDNCAPRRNSHFYSYSIVLNAKDGYRFLNSNPQIYVDNKYTSVYGYNFTYSNERKTLTVTNFIPERVFTEYEFDKSNSLTVENIPETAEYTGGYIEPEPVVKVIINGAERVLEKDTDYTLSYERNNELSWPDGGYLAAVKIIGKGDFYGTITREFTIVPADINNAEHPALPDVPYNGKKYEPEVSLTLYGRELVKDTDYTVEYGENTAAGTGTVTVTGIGYYCTGTKIITFKITEPEPELTPEEAAMPTKEATEIIIKKTNTDKKDVAGSDYRRLMLKATSKGKTITLKWKAAKGADGYIIYGAPCGQKMTLLATITNPKAVKYTFRKLKKGKYYKYIVVAYKKTAIDSRVIVKSKSVHCATAGGKKGNPTGISVKTKLTVKKGKKVKIKAKLLKKGKVATHIAKFRYESSDTEIATVDKNGYINAKKKGTVNIYVYTQNGIAKTIKVKVK